MKNEIFKKSTMGSELNQCDESLIYDVFPEQKLSDFKIQISNGHLKKHFEINKIVVCGFPVRYALRDIQQTGCDEDYLIKGCNINLFEEETINNKNLILGYKQRRLFSIFAECDGVKYRFKSSFRKPIPFLFTEFYTECIAQNIDMESKEAEKIMAEIIHVYIEEELQKIIQNQSEIKLVFPQEAIFSTMGDLFVVTVENSSLI